LNVLTSRQELERFAADLAHGEGPIGLDAERASGYRYSQRAYLVQIHRRGSGTALIDPIALPNLEPIGEAIGETEWILHAATQDLPCLAEVGLRPARLFDTELAGRLLGRERVNLAALVEEELGIELAKGYGAADWSQRPLTQAQLRYAALDVVHLPELRDHLARALELTGKAFIAEQEFEALLQFTPRPTGPEPWRRLSGIHTLRTPEARGIARALWQARDQMAADQDLAPGRILRDREIVAMAKAPTSAPAAWRAVIDTAVPVTDAPERAPDVVPPTKSWPDKRPDAAARWGVARPALLRTAEALHLPVENLMSPQVVREVLWQPPGGVAEISAALAAAGARPWQIDIVSPILADACDGAPPEVTDE
jgi:ribonuclease D